MTVNLTAQTSLGSRSRGDDAARSSAALDDENGSQNESEQGTPSVAGESAQENEVAAFLRRQKGIKDKHTRNIVNCTRALDLGERQAAMQTGLLNRSGFMQRRN